MAAAETMELTVVVHSVMVDMEVEKAVGALAVF